MHYKAKRNLEKHLCIKEIKVNKVTWTHSKYCHRKTAVLLAVQTLCLRKQNGMKKDFCFIEILWNPPVKFTDCLTNSGTEGHFYTLTRIKIMNWISKITKLHGTLSLFRLNLEKEKSCYSLHSGQGHFHHIMQHE